MRCEHCHGFGRIAGPTDPPAYRLEPCQECNGSGVTSCCGDAVCQPPKKEEVDE